MVTHVLANESSETDMNRRKPGTIWICTMNGRTAEMRTSPRFFKKIFRKYFFAGNAVNFDNKKRLIKKDINGGTLPIQYAAVGSISSFRTR